MERGTDSNVATPEMGALLRDRSWHLPALAARECAAYHCLRHPAGIAAHTGTAANAAVSESSAYMGIKVPSLEVGELLIRCMYQAQPQLQQCSQALLLQLVTLADSLDAHKVAEAASRQLQLFAADPSAELQWETAMQIYSLPPACPEMAAYKPLYHAAAGPG